MRSQVALILTLLAWTASLPAFAAEFKYPWHGGVVYGRDLLTKEERRAYWRTLNQLKTHEEQEAFWRAHIAKMQELARQRGVAIENPPRIKDKPNPKTWWRDPYFSEIMTREEIAAYRRDLDALKTTAEQDAYRAAHIYRMQERARQRGIGMLRTLDWDHILQADAERKANAVSGDAPPEGEGVATPPPGAAPFGEAKGAAPAEDAPGDR